MATQPTSATTTTQPLNTSLFFNSNNNATLQTASTTAATQSGGFFSNLASGLTSRLLAPARYTAAEATQGIADRVSDIFSQNQPELTNRMRDIFTQAMLRRAPQKIPDLLHTIQTFQRTPSLDTLNRIKTLLNQLTALEIQGLAPGINSTGLSTLTGLRALLDQEITQTLSLNGSNSTLNMTATATQALEAAEIILKSILENYEGALIQTLSSFTQSMTDPNGALSVMRRQLNDPQIGIITESLNTLRRDLTSQVDPQLREAKTALEGFQAGLIRNLATVELNQLLRNAHVKLSLLLNRQAPISQLAEQWGDLLLFNAAMNNMINDPTQFPLSNNFLPEVNMRVQTLTLGFNAQRGILETASDILVEGIGRGVAQLETLPGRMVQNIFSAQPPTVVQPNAQSTSPTIPQPVTTSPTSSNSTDTETTTSFLNLGVLVNEGRRFLNSIVASAGGAISQNAASALSVLVIQVFVKIRAHIESNAEHQHLRDAIDPMITRLRAAKEQSSWSELSAALTDAFSFIQAQLVYLQGFRLPLNPVRTLSSAIPNFIQNIDNHLDALQPPQQRVPQKISAAMIQEQEKLFKARASCYGPTFFVAEKLCNFTVGQEFYAELFKVEDRSQNDLQAIFRKRLFDKIDSEMNFLSGGIAKASYDFLLFFSSYYLHSFIEGLISFPQKWDPNHSKVEVLVKLMRNWLAVTSGAYNSVANTPASRSRDFSQMMEEAMKIPERNGGLNQNELFNAVAKTALDTFGPRIKWSEIIENYFNVEIPAVSPVHFLNPLVKGLNQFCSFCLKTVVFIPQWIGNQILQGGAKIALSHSPFLKEYTDQTMESLRRNTPASYGMQRMIYRQMQKILLLLQRSLNDDPDNVSNPMNRDTNIKKLEISGLIEYILEVLNKSQYRTQDRLQNFLQNRAPIRDRLGRELEDAAMPEIMESAIMTISIAFDALTDDDELTQILYDSLSLANDSFETNQPVSEEDFAALERGIREISDQILETAILSAVGEKFDFTNEKQKKGIFNFLKTLKDQTHGFTNLIEQKTLEITQGLSASNLSPRDLLHEISTMIEHSAQYNHGRVDALAKADGNRNFHTETKYYLNEMSRQLLTHSSPIANHLNQIKHLADDMLCQDKILQTVLLCHNANNALAEKVQSQRLPIDEVIFCRTQVSLMQTHLAFLRRNRCPLILTESLEASCREFSSALKTIEDHQKADKILQPILPLFQRLKQAKEARITGSSAAPLRQLERQILQFTDALPFTEQKERLNQKVLNLMTARNQENVEVAAHQFLNEFTLICARNSAAFSHPMERIKTTNEALSPHISQTIQDFTQMFMQKQSTLQNSIREIRTGAQNLQQWTQSQNEIQIWNLFIFDMQWVTQTVKNLAFNQARAKVKQLFESLYQRHSYIGFVNQMVLLPFLERFGNHHLKTNAE